MGSSVKIFNYFNESDGKNQGEEAFKNFKVPNKDLRQKVKSDVEMKKFSQFYVISKLLKLSLSQYLCMAMG